MNFTVFTGPYSAKNLDELFMHTPLGLGSLCAVVPDTRSAFEMERRIAKLRGGTSLGSVVYTMERLAREIISLAERVPETVKNHVRRALIGEIVKSRIGDISPYFHASRYPGFVSIVASYLEDIRSSPEIRPHHEPVLESIAQAYASHLNRLGLIDHEGAVNAAVSSGMADRFATSFSGPLIIDGFYDLTDRQFELVSYLCSFFRRSAMTLVHDASRPMLFTVAGRLLSRLQAIGAKTVMVESHPSNVPEIMFSRFMTGHTAERKERAIPHLPGCVEVHHFRSERSEADWVAGSIRTKVVNGTWQPEDILIVSRKIKNHAHPLFTALNRHGITCIEEGCSRPLSAVPVVKLTLDALDAAIQPDRERILLVQRSFYTGARSTGRQPFGDTDDSSWSCMIVDDDSPEGFVYSLKKMLASLEIEGTLAHAEDSSRTTSERTTLEKLMESLDDFALVYSALRPKMKAVEFSRLLRTFLGDVSITDNQASGRGIVLADVEYARYLRRPVVFFTGLDNASFPARHDIYSLHDTETARSLREKKDSEERQLFYMSHAGAEDLYLTFPGIDDEGKDSSISPFLRELVEDAPFPLEPVLHTGIPGEAWEGGFSAERGRSEQVIRKLRMLEADGNEDEPVTALFAANDIERAIRNHLRLREHVGMSLISHEAKTHLANEWSERRIFSVTSLEDYITCPIGFYFSHVLGLKAERPVVDELDARERGILIHTILADFYRALRESNGRTRFTRGEIEKVTGIMRRTIDKALVTRIATVKRLHPIIARSEKRFITNWMDYFLELEADRFADASFSPAFFEVSFGKSQESGEGYQPLELFSEGNSVSVGGRIDRIDTANEGEPAVQVIDYKTGYSPIKSDIEKSLVLQVPLYMKAAAEIIMPETTVRGGLYYSLVNAGYNAEKSELRGCTTIEGTEMNPIIDAAADTAVRVSVHIRHGSFPASTTKCTSFCAWRNLCRGGYSFAGEVVNAD